MVGKNTQLKWENTHRRTEGKKLGRSEVRKGSRAYFFGIIVACKY